MRWPLVWPWQVYTRGVFSVFQHPWVLGHGFQGFSTHTQEGLPAVSGPVRLWPHHRIDAQLYLRNKGTHHTMSGIEIKERLSTVVQLCNTWRHRASTRHPRVDSMLRVENTRTTPMHLRRTLPHSQACSTAAALHPQPMPSVRTPNH